METKKSPNFFLSLINNRRVKLEEKDRLFLKGDKKGTYIVRSNVALLEGNSGRTSPSNMI